MMYKIFYSLSGKNDWAEIGNGRFNTIEETRVRLSEEIEYDKSREQFGRYQYKVMQIQMQEIEINLEETTSCEHRKITI